MAREDVNIKVSANVAEAIQLWKAMEAGPEGMANALEKMGKKGKESSKSTGDELSAMGARLLSVTALVAGVSSALNQMAESGRRAADAISGSLTNFGQLAQISNTPDEFRMNVAFARSLRDRGIVGADQEGLAADITAQFANVGLNTQERELMARIAGQRLIGAEGIGEFAEGVRKFQAGFGEGEAGTVEDVVNKLVQAGNVAQVQLPGLVAASTKFSGEAAQLGFTDEEAMAAFLSVEARSATADVAGTRMSALMTQLTKRGLAKGTLMESIADISQRQAGGENIFSILGESNAVEAYNRIRGNEAFIEQQRQLMTTATQRGVLEQRLGLLGTDPLLAQAKETAEAQGRQAAIEEEKLAPRQLRRDETMARLYEANLQQFGSTAGGVFNAFSGLATRGFESIGLGVIPEKIANTQLSIRLTGSDGRDVPHEVDAAGIQGR